MEIIGKFENKIVIKCDEGHYYEYNTYGTSSGCFFCEHEKGTTYFDYLNLDGLVEITDTEIVEEILSKRPKQK
jgi:hypothetical protein